VSWGLWSSHCLDLDLNGQRTRRNFWCISSMLGNYTIPPPKKKKHFWNRASQFWDNPIYPLLST
jgi:hypothetical protein